MGRADAQGSHGDTGCRTGRLIVTYLDSIVPLRYLLLGEISIKHALTIPRVVSSELLVIEYRRAMDSFPVVIKTLDALHLACVQALNRCAGALGLGTPLAG